MSTPQQTRPVRPAWLYADADAWWVETSEARAIELARERDEERRRLRQALDKPEPVGLIARLRALVR